MIDIFKRTSGDIFNAHTYTKKKFTNHCSLCVLSNAMHGDPTTIDNNKNVCLNHVSMLHYTGTPTKWPIY